MPHQYLAQLAKTDTKFTLNPNLGAFTVFFAIPYKGGNSTEYQDCAARYLFILKTLNLVVDGETANLLECLILFCSCITDS